ncbi:MAG: VOC family protein [Acidobacteria bacterium]|nr:VOC family protein [Acidobacteriota bacterium]
MAIGALGRGQVRDTMPYDHIHLTASDPEKAYDWYLANLEGRAAENAGRLMFEPFTSGRPLPLQLMFIKAPDAGPSQGSVIESIGFSFHDVGAKVKALEAAGARVVAPVRDTPGFGKRAAVVDPWGVTIELVEDHAQLGFHHITLRLADPAATIEWLLAAFGGERVKMGGTLDALRYGRTYVAVVQGAGAAPSQGRAIDHLGWGPRDIDATAAALKAKGVAFTAAPSPKPNQFGHRTAYVDAPGGVRIELVQHAECAWGKN